METQLEMRESLQRLQASYDALATTREHLSSSMTETASQLVSVIEALDLIVRGPNVWVPTNQSGSADRQAEQQL